MTLINVNPNSNQNRLKNRNNTKNNKQLPKLNTKEYIFYENLNDLKKKIEFFKNNLSVYYSIKQEIYEISKNLKKDTHRIFFDEFIK